MAALEEAFGDVIQRQISDDASFERWKGSSARKEIVAFVARLNNSCVNKSNLRLDAAPPQVRKLMELLRAIAKGCDQYLPKPGEARRYGSPTFRDWHAWLVASAPELVASLGSDSAELSARLAASFGDRTRIDYGTGHECAFVVFLLGCFKLQLITDGDVDGGAVVCGAFAEYIRTCRVVQRCFGLEPAGSKGVWALDDYQLLPFLFGCSQLADESKGFGDEDTGLLTVNASSLSQRSMFYECLAFVDESTGTTPLDVAAPILFNLTMQPWRTNARRLLRLFDEEVLGQKPVVQHMLFGELLRADWDSNTGPSEESERLARMKAVMDAANRKLGIGSDDNTADAAHSSESAQPPQAEIKTTTSLRRLLSLATSVRAMTTAVWFRKNLRVHDNAALTAACDDKAVLPLYCLDPAWATPQIVGPNRCRFLLESLEDLDRTLQSKYGSRLHVVVGDPSETITKLIRDGTITKVVFEEEVAEPRELELEKRVVEAHPDEATAVPSTHSLYDADAALAKGAPPTKMPGMVTLAGKLGPPSKPLMAPSTLPPRPDVTSPPLPSLESLGYSPITTNAAYAVTGGESTGLQRLQEQMKRENGKWARAFEKPKTTSASFEGEPPTTLLSPYVAFGCVSVRTFHQALKETYAKGPHAQPPTSLLGQLYFREMSYLLGKKHGPQFAEQPSSVCKDIDWDTDAAAEKRFEAWEQGRTGYPLIDAAMRQLREQGWLHHLARHAVSCFLTRGDLYCHWTRGRDVFDRDLLDADWAINNFNWLGLAGVAPWSPPFFRVYNPFNVGSSSLNVRDAEGKYVDRFVPELSKLPPRHKYAPWLAPKSDLSKAGVKLGETYPRPIVDHKAQSKVNIERFKQAQRAAKEASTSKKRKGPPVPAKAKRSK